MKVVILAAIIVFALGVVIRPSDFVTNAYETTARLYSLDPSPDGTKAGLCSAIIVQKLDDGYLMATARHCLYLGTLEKPIFTISFDDKKAYFADEVATSEHDDISIVKIVTTKEYPVVPLGDEKLLHIGDPLTTAGFPLNLDKMFFRGYVACLQNPDRPLLVDMVFSYGSSGSGVFSENQEALVGIATDMYEDTDNDRVISSAVPVSKLKILLDSIQRPL